MIYCYLCPLKDLCPIPEIQTEPPNIPIKLNWLPNGAKNECPLYKATNEHGKK